ncbi:MAG: TerB family tellurite resistance protein [Geminicoccaceae bacterium]
MTILDRLRQFMQPEASDASRRPGTDQLQLAAAALLVEAATMDAQFSEAERAHIVALLGRRFGLDRAEAGELLALAEQKAADSVEWHGYTRVIKEQLDHEERIGMLEMLWEVVYADGRLHDYEASLLRRVTGLLYVGDRESGAARKRVLARLGLEHD